MNTPINPKILKPHYKPWNEPGFATGRFYIPVLIGEGLILRARKTFQRASEAKTYAERLHARWCKLAQAGEPV